MNKKIITAFATTILLFLTAFIPTAHSNNLNKQTQSVKPMSKQNKMVVIALEEVGTKEKPAGSNCVKKYFKCHKNGSLWPWSAIFVGWTMKQAGFTTEIADNISVQKMYKQAAKQKLVKTNKNKIKKGDLLLFGKPPTFTHIAIVVSANKKYVKTVGGNENDQVLKRILSKAHVKYYINLDKVN